MSTSLVFITNSNHNQSTIKDNQKSLLARLNNLDLNECEDSTHEGWVIEELKDEYLGNSLELSSDSVFFISAYDNSIVFSTTYKYSLLYESNIIDKFFDSHKITWFNSFRKEVYRLIQVFGGAEVIFLADNGCDKLSSFLVLLEEENWTYLQIKKRMIEELGQPITDCKLLDNNKLDYNNITEFILDDFDDLKFI